MIFRWVEFSCAPSPFAWISLFARRTTGHEINNKDRDINISEYILLFAT
jgi:hypothetical protein